MMPLSNSSPTPETTPPTLTGNLVMLRAPRESDKQDRIKFGREPEYRIMVGLPPLHQRSLTEQEAEVWYARICHEPLTWIIEYDRHCIGEARLHSLDSANRRARYAVGIYSSAYWDRGIGTEATELVLKYAFESLKLHRIDLRVLELNHRAISCYKKCGFVAEGVEREGIFVNGEWQSDAMMSILEQEYQRCAK